MEHKMDNKVLPPPLLRLPAELIDYIFELACEEAILLDLLCRALLPFHTRILYRYVELKTRKEVILFRHAATKQQNVGSMTRSLLLDLSDDDSNGVVDPGNPVNLLKHLPQLRRLILDHVEPTIIRLFLQGVHTLPLPFLNKLDLRPARPVDLPEEIKVTNLASFPSLNNLSLSFQYFPHHFFTSCISSLTSIKSITLGDNSYETYPAFDLAALFPNLDILGFGTNDFWPDYRKFLRTAPTILPSLILACASDAEDDPTPNLDLADILPRFPSLRNLHLCQYVFHHATILPVLQSFDTLHHLIFGPCAPISDNLLLSIVQEPTKLQQLQQSTLDYVEAARGDTIQEHDWELSVEADYTDGHTYPGWTAPAWNDDSSEAGLSNVTRAGKAAGILVEGTALEARHWEADHGTEVFRCTILWGCEEGDLSEAFELYSKACVSDWLELAFPELWEEFFVGEKEESEELEELEEESE